MTQTLIGNRIDTGDLKQRIKINHECPLCKSKIRFGIESRFLENLESSGKKTYSHCYIHDAPGIGLHALFVYIDANGMVRGIESAQSIEISREGNTFGQLMKKWSNPF